MKKLDENGALAIVFANIRRKKRSDDLITIAKSFEHLFKLYGSQKAVADKVGLSPEMVRQFLAVLKLQKKVQKLFSKRQIDSVDTAKELLALKDSAKQIKAAKAISDSLSKDTRDIKRLVRGSDVPVEEAKKAVLNAKPKGLHIFVMDFDDEMYRAIMRQAKILKINPVELVREIVIDWLKHRARIKEKHGGH
jgi:hypothetical protein